MVLNPALYEALESRFGSVKISNEGQEMNGTYTHAGTERRRLIVSDSGEYYRVSCPFCSDTRHRLYINHRWGVRDEETGGLHRWAAYCFNADCLSEPDNFTELIRMTTWYQREAGAGRVGVSPVKVLQAFEMPPISLPRDFQPLSALPDDHLAIRYLRERNFNPAGVEKKWGVGFSARDSFCLTVHGRLLIPFRRESEDDIETVGWQSRRLVDPEEPRNKVLDEGEGKYFTAQGFKKSMFVYGAERPLPESGPLVVCEGVTDVWRYGPGAVAVLGKFASHYQRQVLLRLGRGRPLVIAFDGDARKDAEELASFLVEQKQESILYHDDHPIVVLPLSPEEDPASLRRVVLRERVASLFA